MRRLSNASYIASVALLLGIGSAFGQTTAFTYQGRLMTSGAAANGLHDFRFRLFDAGIGDAQVGATICVDNVSVDDGLFTLQLDFGQQFATSAPRFLEIDVRTDTGLNCLNFAGFTTLAPRQQLTATPLASHAKSAFALDAADGSPASAVFVDNAGNVGIGTTTPGKALTVNGDMEVGINSSDYRHLCIGGGNSDGFLYGSFPHFGDGIHIGYNYFADASGANHIIHPDGGTSRITMQYGAIVFATAPAFGGEPINRVIVESGGNVRVGPNTQLYATSGDENLRIVRGNISVGVGGANLTITAGSGFSVQAPSIGKYILTFDTPFSGTPTVTATARQGACDYYADVAAMSASGAEIHVLLEQCTERAWSGFTFIAVGPR